jgi:hypothetical protein
MSKHTPGPWFVTEGGQYIEAARYEHGGRQIVGKPQGDNPEQWNANARLMAAAPELLEALKLALSSLETAWHEIDGEWGPIISEFGDLEGAVSQGHCSTDAIRAARSAIAKATGETK